MSTTYIFKIRDNVIGFFGYPLPTLDEALAFEGYTIGDEEELIDENGEYTGMYLEEVEYRPATAEELEPDPDDDTEEAKEARREALAAGLDEMIAQGWTADEAIENKEGFFERIGDLADGIPAEEVWEIWENIWEIKMEEGEMLSNNYYWLDTTETWNSPRKGEMILIRGQYNEDGEKDRDTEEEVLKFTEADCGIIPGDDDKAWKKIDSYITEQLGFLPDYEIN